MAGQHSRSGFRGGRKSGFRLFWWLFMLWFCLLVVFELLVGSDLSEMEVEAMVKRVKIMFFGGLRGMYGGALVEEEDFSGLFLHQSKYARDLLQKAGLEKCTSQPTPMTISSSTNGADTPFADITHFRSLIGALQYLAITHPDMLSTDRGLLIRPGDLELRGFFDSDWANDKNDRKSTSGFLFFWGRTLSPGVQKNNPRSP
uniref:Reverse transcriptase Ty1/copia-type domain-containing protein n=1 Tax=Solanum lycopersicum TaxID=4081 RepID=A0A3Q7GWC0_SOLLC